MLDAYRMLGTVLAATYEDAPVVARLAKEAAEIVSATSTSTNEMVLVGRARISAALAEANARLREWGWPTY